MFDDVDETLRRLLIQEIPIMGNEIEIAFDMPKREWSARLNRPTLNLYLHDVRENAKLRQNYTSRVSQNLTSREVEVRRPELRVDLHYMVTAWANEPDDEHRLLGRTLMALVRNSALPEAMLVRSLQNQPRPVTLSVAQYDALLNPTDIWGVLDNDLRPCLSCIITLTLEPHRPIQVPVVRTRELRMVDMERLSIRKEPMRPRQAIAQPPSRRQEALARLEEQPPANGDAILSQRWTVGGRLRLDRSLQGLSMSIEESGIDVPLAADGTFVIGYLREGSYTLLLTDGEEEVLRQAIQVPSDGYEITG
jgi:hypothetical protein